MITADKLLAFPDRLGGNMAPITADVFLTRRCNNSCSYCTYTRYMRRSGAEMTEELFDKVLLRLIDLGVEGVILTGGGEPTVAKCFMHAAKSMELMSVPYGVNTNFNRYVECKPAYLKISLDAWDEESYFSIRGVRAYEKTRENIKRFFSWKEKNSPDTRVVIQSIAKSPNDVEMFYSANADLPCDTIVFRPVESTGGRYYLGAESSEINEVIGAINQIEDSRVVLNPKFYEIGTTFDKCFGQRFQIAVDESANVLYCCHKPYEVVGRLFDEDIILKKAAYCTDMEKCDVPCRLTAGNTIALRAAAVRGMVDSAFI